MRTAIRIACMVIGVLAFLYALDEFASLLFDTGNGSLTRLIILSGISAAAFAVLIFMYQAETYPERLKAELFDEELERKAKQQLGIR